MTTFGERIGTLRKGRGMTQRAFAMQLGIDFTYVSKIEHERVDAPPSEALITRMAQILGENAETLLVLAGQFDHRDLQTLAMRNPAVSLLLRRLQRHHVTDDQLRHILAILEHSAAAG